MYPSFDLFIYTLIGRLSTKSDSKHHQHGENYTRRICLSISKTASHPSGEWTLTPIDWPTSPLTWVPPEIYPSLGKTTVSEEQSKNLQWDNLSTTIDYSAYWTEGPTSLSLGFGNRTTTLLYPCATKKYCCHKPDNTTGRLSGLKLLRILFMKCTKGIMRSKRSLTKRLTNQMTKERRCPLVHCDLQSLLTQTQLAFDKEFSNFAICSIDENGIAMQSELDDYHSRGSMTPSNGGTTSARWTPPSLEWCLITWASQVQSLSLWLMMCLC